MTSGILVLEGADAAGKTTLARHLVNEHGARYIHLGPYKDVWRRHLAAYHRAARLAAAGELVVVDRHWMSECVYGQVYRGGSAYPVSARCFDRLWLRSAAVYVFCVPVDLDRQLAEHHQLLKRRTEYAMDIRPVATAYYRAARWGTFDFVIEGNDYFARQIRLWPWTDWPHAVTYDCHMEGGDLEQVADRLLRLLTAWREQQHPLGLDPAKPNFAGHWGPARWLVVGEAPSPCVTRPDLAFPFVDRCTNLSATTWLNRALHYLDLPEPTLLWTNAYKTAGDRRPSQVLSLLSQDERIYSLPAIALGRRAERALHDLGWVDVRHVPHPQWARRFDHHGDYARQLEEVFR